MTSYYFVDFSSLVQGKEAERVKEIEEINPDVLIALCLEEFDYHYIFSKFFELIKPYLQRTNKKLKLIAPFIDSRPVPDNIEVEDSYGYLHWATTTPINCLKTGIKFNFNNDVKLFTCYNNNVKYQRAILVDQFAKHDLLKDGIVTLIHPEMRLPNGSIYSYKYHDGRQLKDEEDFVLNSSPNYAAGILPKNYLNGFIDIVSESTYGKGQFFLTEKTAKPIGALKPFLVLGPPNFHKYLNEKYDLEYYTELFDYSFDKEDDVEKRIDGIVQNLIRLRDTPINKLMEIHLAITNKMIRNRINFINIQNDRDRFTPKSLSFLHHDKNIKLYGDTNASIFYAMGIII
jgi:hypothetical protein